MTDATAAANPQIGAAANTAGADVTAAAGQAGAGAASAADRANGLINPYSATGETATTALNDQINNGQFSGQPTLDQLQMDPGYAFRLQQGQLALDRSAAARGGVTSGGQLKALSDYTQGSASQEYQNAFNRFETSQQNNFSDLNTLANTGLSASNAQGGNLINAAQYGGTANLNAQQYQGTSQQNAADLTASNTINAANSSANYLTQGANAAAAGTVGSANATTGAISGATNAISGAGTLYGLLNPSTSSSSAPGNYLQWATGTPSTGVKSR